MELFKVSRETYGDGYQGHLLDQYRLYVEMADRISQRRQSANAYFLSANTLLGVVSGLLASNSVGPSANGWRVCLPLAGIALSLLWAGLVNSYKQLNSGKFKVIHAIEQQLPIAPYDAEWEALGRGNDPKLYWPFSHVEVWVPWVFGVLYVALLLISIF